MSKFLKKKGTVTDRIAFYEKAIIYRALSNQDELVDLLLKGKISPAFFTPIHAKVLSIIIDYYKKYSARISLGALTSTLLDEDISITFTPEEYTHVGLYYWNHVLTLKQTKEIKLILSNIELNTITSENIINETKKIVELLNLTLNKYNRDTKVPRRLSEVYPDVMEEYINKQKGDLQGVVIPFEHLKDCIGVWGPGEMSACLARTNVGKTWWTIINAIAAAEQGYTCLYASKEMLETKLGRRLLSVGTKTNYSKFVKGELSPEEITALEDLYEKKKSCFDNIIIADPQTLDKHDTLELYIKQFNPYFVVIDAFYMFQNVPGDQFWQKVSFLTKYLKNLATTTGTHIQLTSQFNKMAKSRKLASEMAVGFSDAINHDADYRIDLFQNPKDVKMRQVEMTIGKGRESEKGATVVYNWNFLTMDFTSTGMVIEAVEEEDNPFLNQ